MTELNSLYNIRPALELNDSAKLDHFIKQEIKHKKCFIKNGYPIINKLKKT